MSSTLSPHIAEQIHHIIALKALELNKEYQNATLQTAPQIEGFELKSILGKGSFSTVFLAIQQSNHQTCALKIGVLDKTERFLREVKHMNAIDHPAVLTCLDSGIVTHHQQQYYWMSMANMPFNLADLLKYGVLEKDDIWGILIQICLGLSALHEKEIIHRDLKPANCLISADLQVKLSDFGLSKNISLLQKDQTLDESLTHQAIGTPAYMSPEQINGDTLSFESDIFSFAMIMYECFAKKLPFTESQNVVNLMAKMLYESIPFEAIEREIDAQALALLKKCLEKNPKLRFKNALELKNHFIPLAEFEIQKIRHDRDRKIWDSILSQELIEHFWLLHQKQPIQSPFDIDHFLDLYQHRLPKIIDRVKLSDILIKLKQINDEYQWDHIVLDESLVKYKIKIELQRLLRQELMAFEFKQIEQKRLEGEKRREELRKKDEIDQEEEANRHRAKVHYRLIENQAFAYQTLEIISAQEIEKEQGFWIWKKTKRIQESLAQYRLIYCQAGAFWMGSDEGIGTRDERPKHRVKISRGFWLGESVVTQNLWQAVLGWNPSAFTQHPLLPVENITWFDCLWFCNQFSKIQGLEECYQMRQIQRNGHHISFAVVKWNEQANGYRLPTEAEWEYAAKAGTEFLYAGSQNLDEVGWYEGNAKDHGQYQPHIVKSKKPNAWGLYDMSGNVWEWCHDAWDGDAYRKRIDLMINPVYWEESPFSCVLRGGSFRFNAEFCRVATRFRYDSDYKNSRWGIRLLKQD